MAKGVKKSPFAVRNGALQEIQDQPPSTKDIEAAKIVAVNVTGGITTRQPPRITNPLQQSGANVTRAHRLNGGSSVKPST